MTRAGVGRYTTLARRPAGLPAPPPAAETDVTIDFDHPLPGSELGSLSFGSCISTFAGDGQDVNIIKGGAAGAAWKATLGALGRMVWRIPLAWNGGRPGSAAGGARSYGDAGAYLKAIREIGGLPMIAVGGTTNDNDITAADAANLVHYVNDGSGTSAGAPNGGPVDHWIIGNEPDNGFGVGSYIDGGAGCSGFSAIAAAMRAATNRTLSIAGPAFVEYASYKEAELNRFLDTCGAQLDRIDVHKYGSGDGIRGDLAATHEYAIAVRWLRGAVAARPATAGRVAVQVGEFNFHPFYDPGAYGPAAFYTSRNTVHTASAIGHVVNAGGAAYQYSDNNGPLGLITPGNGDNGAPSGRRLTTPAYQGIAIWTGGDLFRRPTGSMATVAHSVIDLEVFASTGTKNVIVVNRSEGEARTVVIATGSVRSGSYTLWQTVAGFDPADAEGPQWARPRRVGAGAIVGGRLTLTAPAMTVSCLLL